MEVEDRDLPKDIGDFDQVNVERNKGGDQVAVIDDCRILK